MFLTGEPPLIGCIFVKLRQFSTLHCGFACCTPRLFNYSIPTSLPTRETAFFVLQSIDSGRLRRSVSDNGGGEGGSIRSLSLSLTLCAEVRCSNLNSD